MLVKQGTYGTWSIDADHDSVLAIPLHMLEAAGFAPKQRVVIEIKTERNDKKRWLHLEPVPEGAPRQPGHITFTHKARGKLCHLAIQSMKLDPEGRWERLMVEAHPGLLRMQVPLGIKAHKKVRYSEPEMPAVKVAADRAELRNREPSEEEDISQLSYALGLLDEQDIETLQALLGAYSTLAKSTQGHIVGYMHGRHIDRPASAIRRLCELVFAEPEDE